MIQSVTGTPLALSDISGTVQNLQNIITEGTEFTANVNYRRDHVSYLGASDNGDALYGIKLVDGSTMLDENGTPLSFSDRDAAINYYRQLRGYAPAAGMEFTSFSAKKLG